MVFMLNSIIDPKSAGADLGRFFCFHLSNLGPAFLRVNLIFQGSLTVFGSQSKLPLNAVLALAKLLYGSIRVIPRRPVPSMVGGFAASAQHETRPQAVFL
jgi:hypothetical protein